MINGEVDMKLLPPKILKFHNLSVELDLYISKQLSARL